MRCSAYRQYRKYLVTVATSIINRAETEKLSCWKFENTFHFQSFEAGKHAYWLKINKVLENNCFLIVQIP